MKVKALQKVHKNNLLERKKQMRIRFQGLIKL